MEDGDKRTPRSLAYRVVSNKDSLPLTRYLGLSCDLHTHAVIHVETPALTQACTHISHMTGANVSSWCDKYTPSQLHPGTLHFALLQNFQRAESLLLV